MEAIMLRKDTICSPVFVLNHNNACRNRSEFLDPFLTPYIADLICWGALVPELLNHKRIVNLRLVYIVCWI